jgi:hypothetical protein
VVVEIPKMMIIGDTAGDPFGLMNGFQGSSQNAYEIPWCRIPIMLFVDLSLSSSLCLHL